MSVTGADPADAAAQLAAEMTGGLEVQPSDVLFHDLQQQAAEANLAKDLAEQINGTWLKAGRSGALYIGPTVTAHVIAQACKEFFARHRGEGVWAEVMLDQLRYTLYVSFETSR